MWGGKVGKVAPGFDVPARSVWFEQAESCMPELWLTGDADDPVRHSSALSLPSTPVQEAATPTAGTAPGYQVLVQHSSYAGTAAYTFGALHHCTAKQLKASTGWWALLLWFSGPAQGARALCGPHPAATCEADGQDLRAVWSHWEQLQFFRLLVLKVQRGISELLVIANTHGKVKNTSCWVFSWNSFDMDIVNSR